MKKKIKHSVVKYTDEFKNELDRRNASYYNDTSKSVTAEESKKRIQKLLKAAGK